MSDRRAERQRSKVRQIYAGDSDYYATSRPHAASGSLHRAVELLRDPPPALAVDVATGAGHTALALSEYCRMTVASDLTLDMLLAARRLAATRGVRNVRLLAADAEHLPLATASAPAITVRIAPHHFADVRRFLHEVRRVLPVDGRLVYVDNVAPEEKQAAALYNDFERRRDPSHGRCVSPSTLDRWLQEAGLVVRSHDTLRKRLVFDDWTRRPHLSNADRCALRDLLLDGPPELLDWLRPRMEEGELIFDEVESIVLATATDEPEGKTV